MIPSLVSEAFAAGVNGERAAPSGLAFSKSEAWFQSEHAQWHVAGFIADVQEIVMFTTDELQLLVDDCVSFYEGYVHRPDPGEDKLGTVVALGTLGRVAVKLDGPPAVVEAYRVGLRDKRIKARVGASGYADFAKPVLRSLPSQYGVASYIPAVGWRCASQSCPVRNPVKTDKAPVCYTCGQLMVKLSAITYCDSI